MIIAGSSVSPTWMRSVLSRSHVFSKFSFWEGGKCHQTGAEHLMALLHVGGGKVRNGQNYLYSPFDVRVFRVCLRYTGHLGW